MQVRTSQWLAGLFLLGLIPRLLLLLVNPSGLEFWEYETLAQSIASGNGYAITHFGQLIFAFGDGNLYSFLAAAVYVAVGHQPLVLAVVQAVLASLAGPVIFVIGRGAFGWQVSALGAALATLHPGLLAYTMKLHPLGLDVLLLALAVLWIRRTGVSANTGLMAGLSLGLSLMSRPTFFLAGLAALAVRWCTRGSGAERGSESPRRLLPLLVPVFVALVVAAPWVVRNWAVLGQPVFVSTSLEDVWKGNNPAASGSSYLPGGQDVLSTVPPNMQARLQTSNELQHNDVFAGEIVEFVSQRPSDFIALTGRKFVYFWWHSPQEGMLYPASWAGEYGLYFGVVAVFGVVGSIGILMRGSAEERALLATLAVIGLTLAIVHALSYVEGRHRWGIEPLLLLLSARGIVSVTRSLGGERWLVRRWPQQPS